MTSNDELKFFGNEREITHYRDQATKIEYPNIAQESPETVTASQPPRRVRHPKREDIVDLSLEEALRTALLNAEVIRDSGQFLNPGNRLLNNPDFTSSIYDVAIQESNQLFGQGGVQAALAEFDATLTANMMWGRSENAVDTATTGFASLSGMSEEFGDFRSQLSKIFGDGGQFNIEHNVFYTKTNTTNRTARPFNSEFTSRPSASQDGGLPMLGFEYRRPILQGAGTEYTRIAGPVARRPTLQSTPTVNQGVVIARIRTDISIADFEASVAQLLHDTEDLYWQLHLAYRTYDAETIATKSAVQTWREVRVNMDAGTVGAADEAQARDNYFESRARRESALSNLYQLELQLRRLMGVQVNSGAIFRPVDDPITAELVADWNMTLAEGLANRTELRKQKWNIKSLELQRTAAESLVKPRLDLVARYQMNGFGDKLLGDGGTPGTPGNHFYSAYGTLFNSEFQGWGAGFEFSMPLGFRGAVTQLQNLDHRIAKSRALLAQQEQEISYELGNVLQQIDQSYQVAKTNFNRRRAAERRVQAAQSEYEVGRTTLDLLLRAQISLAQADIAYYSTLVQYNRALNDLNFRKGSILVDRNVYLSESLWTEDAYADALRRAWVRSFAFDAPNMRTAPEEFAFGCADCDVPAGLMSEPQPLPMEDSLPSDIPPPLEPDNGVPGLPEGPKSPDAKTAFREALPETGGLADPGLYDEPLPLPGDAAREPGVSSFNAVSPASSRIRPGRTGLVPSAEASPPSVPTVDDSAFAPVDLPGGASSRLPGNGGESDPFAPPVRRSPSADASSSLIDRSGDSSRITPARGNPHEFLPPVSAVPNSGSPEIPADDEFQAPVRTTAGASRRQLLGDLPASRAASNSGATVNESR